MSDLEVKKTSIQLNSNPTDNTSQPKAQKEDAVKPNIFVGMTKAQAEKAGLLDEFNKANSINSKDGIITQDELNKYKSSNKNIQIITIGSNPNKIVSDIHATNAKAIAEIKATNPSMTTDKAQEVCSKKSRDEMANAQMALIKAAKIDPEKIKTAAKLTENQLNDAIAIAKEKIYVHAGMTKAQAEKKGGASLKYFNLISNGKDTISESDIIAYKQAKLQEKGISIESILKTAQDTSDKGIQIKIQKAIIDTMTDENAVREDFKDIKDLNGFVDKLGISKDEWENAKTPQEKGKILADAFSKIIKQDTNLSDVNSRVYKEIADIANGHLTQDELDQGYAVGDKLSQNELMKLAMGRIVKEYASTISYVSETVFNGIDNKEKQTVVESLFGSLDEMKELREVLASLGINSMTDGKEKTETVRDFAKNETESGNFDAASLTGAMATSTIVQNGDDETVNNFIVNNSNQVDTIKAVANSAVESMPDSDRKTSLQNVVNTAVKTAETVNTQNQNNTSKTGNNVSTPDRTQAPVSNPIYDNKGNDVNTLAEKSHAFMGSRITKSPYQQRKENMQQVQLQMEKAAEELHKKMGIAIEGLKNKPPEKALSIVFSHYDQMPDKAKTYFINYLTRQFNEHPDALCEIYLKGDNTVRQFLHSQHIMSINDIYKHLDKHPEDIVYANKTITTNYYAYSSKKMMKEIMNKPFKKREELQNNSNWHVLDFKRTQLT